MKLVFEVLLASRIVGRRPLEVEMEVLEAVLCIRFWRDFVVCLLRFNEPYIVISMLSNFVCDLLSYWLMLFGFVAIVVWFVLNFVWFYWRLLFCCFCPRKVNDLNCCLSLTPPPSAMNVCTL